MKSYFDQKITHKALSFKLDDSGKLLDAILESSEGEDVKKSLKMKNVCAQLTEPVINRLENTLNILNMSKREFLELAIIEALDKCQSIMNDVGLHEYIDQFTTKSQVAGHIMKIGNILEKNGEKYLELEISEQSIVDSDLIEGDISAMKPGDILQKRGDKYVLVQEAA